MVLFIVRWVDVSVAVISHLFFLELVGEVSRRPHCFCVAFDADGRLNIALGNCGINRPRGHCWIWQVSSHRNVLNECEKQGSVNTICFYHG